MLHVSKNSKIGKNSFSVSWYNERIYTDVKFFFNRDWLFVLLWYIKDFFGYIFIRMTETKKIFSVKNKLSEREWEVMNLFVIWEKTAKEIAMELAISHYTAQDHKSNSLEKLGCGNIYESIPYVCNWELKKYILPENVIKKLTYNEIRVLEALWDNLWSKSRLISKSLYMSQDMLQMHMKNILNKLTTKTEKPKLHLTKVSLASFDWFSRDIRHILQVSDT